MEAGPAATSGSSAMSLPGRRWLSEESVMLSENLSRWNAHPVNTGVEQLAMALADEIDGGSIATIAGESPGARYEPGIESIT